MMKTAHARVVGISALFVAGILFPATLSAATTWDLQADWSNTQNVGVGGAWTFRNISGGLFNLLQSPIPSENTMWDIMPDGSSISRLTDGAMSLAGIGTTAAPTCPEGTQPYFPTLTCMGGGVARPTGSVAGVAYEVRWTAPFDTTIWVTGDVWMMRTLPSHDQTLQVKLDGVDQGTNLIPTTSRSNTPYMLSTAYGANFLQGLHVTAGQTLDFIVNIDLSAPNRYDFVGMDLHIVGDEPPPDVPEPSTLGLMLSGLAATGFLARRSKA